MTVFLSITSEGGRIGRITWKNAIIPSSKESSNQEVKAFELSLLISGDRRWRNYSRWGYVEWDRCWPKNRIIAELEKLTDSFVSMRVATTKAADYTGGLVYTASTPGKKQSDNFKVLFLDDQMREPDQ